MGVQARLGVAVPEQANPAAPGAGKRLLYPKTDGKWYSKSSTGAEVQVGGDAVVPVQTAEPTGTPEGHMYWDSDYEPPAAPPEPGTHDSLVASLRTHAILTGGGTITVDANRYVSWSYPFVAVSNGRGAHYAAAGNFDISLPAVGTGIPEATGGPSKTVTAAGIQLGNWEALYYILPIGGGSASVPGNFRYVQNPLASDLVIPEHWVLIATLNGDDGVVRFGTGASVVVGTKHYPDVGWINATLINGWVYWGTPHAVPAYRRLGSRVQLKGLIKNGTLSTPAFVLPAGYRPSEQLICAGNSPNMLARIDIFTDGQVMIYEGSASWLSLSSISFIAEQ